jgi:hypothetical protein
VNRISYNIMGIGRASEEMMFNYMRRHNTRVSDQKLRYIIRSYIWESLYEGVNHDISFANMCHETNFLKFDGLVNERQNNFNTLGTMDEDIYSWFFTIRDGIRAHVQHLKAYGSKLPLKHDCIDPRFGLIKRGIAKRAHDLGGYWAPNCGSAIVAKVDALLGIKNKPSE